MSSRHTGTIRGSGLGGGKSYDAIRDNYVPVGDDERERAAQPSPREIVARLHAEIALKDPELVAKYERLQARRAQP